MPGDSPGGDVREQISAAEARFEDLRHRIALWLGPPLGVAVWLAGADTPAGRLAGIMTFTAVWWIGEAIPVAMTAMLAAAATVLCGVAGARQAFAAFGHPLLFLFVGSFMMAEAMIVHGVGERMARAAYRVAHGRFAVMVTLSATAFLLSLWMSNSAATAVIIPVALAVALDEKDRRFAAALVLAIAYGASVGGIGTPVGTPPNLIGIARLREAGVTIGFLRWMAIGLPIGAVMLAVLWGILGWRFGVRPGQRIRAERTVTAPPPWSRAEKVVACAFGLAVLLWILPGIVTAVAPSSAPAAWLGDRLREEVVALLAASILFVVPIAGVGPGARAALTWKEAARIDWGTILLFGGGIMLGDLATTTGLAAQWGDALVSATGADSVWTITALLTGVSILLSEATNNTATATLMAPIGISLATAASVPLAPPILGITLGASFGFMLPISTAPNAIAFGTGRVTIREMAGAGIWFDLIGYGVILLGLRVLCPLLGLV